MAWRNPFKRQIQGDGMDHTREGVGVNGFGAPLKVSFGGPRTPPGIADNAGLYPYETYLSPRWTPIGGGIPNKRDVGTAPPAYSKQGLLVQQVGSPGILAGAFVSGPLTNVSTDESSQPIPVASFAIPAA